MNGNELVTALKGLRKSADQSETMTRGIMCRVSRPSPLSHLLLREMLSRGVWTLGILALLWVLCQSGALILISIDTVWPSPVVFALEAPGLEVRLCSFLALALRSCIPLAVHGLVICLLISILSIPHPATTRTWEGSENHEPAS